MHIYKILITFIIIFLIIFSLSFPSLAIDASSYVWSSTIDDSLLANSDLSSQNSNTETNNTDENNSLNLECGSAILIEQKTGQILYSHNIHEQLRPASVTKVMSILLIMESIESGKIALTDKVPCSENAASMGGSQIWLDTKESLTVDDMLKAICVNSANDCVVAMAEFIGGSEDAFVELMNQKAKSLGMKTAHFENACGLDTDNHLLSAKDIAIMSRELITKYPEVTKYTTTWQDTITHTTKKGTTEFGLTNTNKLLKWYNNATGLKTGSTGKALYCLSATAKKDGMELIAVIMAAPDPKLRFREAIQLLDFGFANYKLIHGKKVGEEITDVPIYKGEKDTVKAVVQREFTTLANKGSKAELTTKTEIIPSVQAPVAKGTKLGELVYYIGNKEMGRVNLISKDAVNKANLGTMFQRLTYLWFR